MFVQFFAQKKKFNFVWNEEMANSIEPMIRVGDWLITYRNGLG